MIIKNILFYSLAPKILTTAVDFPKDGDTDKHDFPPDGFLGASSGMPYGHLRPLGHQRRSLGEVDTKTYPDEISLRNIYNHHISKDKPVLLKNFFDMEAVAGWADDDFFPENFREMVVETVAKVPGKAGATKPVPMRIGKFTDFYRHEDWYLVSTLSEIMETKTPLPPFLQCGPFANVVEEARLWFSYGMTSSHIHKDHQETMLCLLDGRKDIILIEPDQVKHLKTFMVPDDVMGYTRLSADADHINMFTESAIGRLGWKHATLRAGDCMYLPAGQFHHIRSHGRALALSYHWEPLTLRETTGFEECETQDYRPIYTNVGDLNLKYRANIRGKRYIDLDYYQEDLETFRNDLLALNYGNGYIEQEDFFRMWQLWAYNSSPEDYMRIAWNKISQSMTTTKASTNRVKVLTKEDLGSLFKLLKRIHMKAIDPVGFRRMHDEL